MSYPLWSDRHPLASPGNRRVEVRFAGRGEQQTREATLQEVEPSAPAVAALKQVHSARVVRVDGPGFAGEGDALVTAQPGLALSVITADCVPALISMGDAIAAVHAGWRGVVAGVVPAAVDEVRNVAGASANEVAPVAWIGPAIGACCYEVGADVAAQVVAASGEEVATPGPAGKPHLDMALAVELQLRRTGIADVRRLGPCTRCESELLWSYRREGAKAGRNIAYVWIRERSA